jgi:hypothetical protein
MATPETVKPGATVSMKPGSSQTAASSIAAPPKAPTPAGKATGSAGSATKPNAYTGKNSK